MSLPDHPGRADRTAPAEGGRYLTRLPTELAGRNEYAHAVAIACPSNQTGDKVRSVTYPLNLRYLDFANTVTAHVRPTGSVPDPRVELTWVASDPGRCPAHPGPGEGRLPGDGDHQDLARVLGG